jgi:citrate lyase subunit gamma (acyl carrier protein)
MRMKIVREALAGTLESSDLLVRISPKENGLELVLHSEVIHQFGPHIERVARDCLTRLGITQALVIIEDKGALDCVVAARVQTAISRAVDEWAPDWSALS